MSPVGQRIQDILRSGVFAIEKPHVADAQFPASLAGFYLADVGQSGSVLSAIVISAAPPTCRKDHRTPLVRVLNGPPKVMRCPCLLRRFPPHHPDFPFPP